jgi:hypothetical protein
VVTGCCAADAACDDGNVCTQDACVGHRCVFTIIPECCRTDVSCDDGDVCTTDTCEANTCTAALPAGLDAVRCRLDGDALTCGPDAMADRLRRALHRRINRAQSRLERAAVSGDARRTKRLLRRAATQVQRARRRIERALRREKLAPRCADALLDALAPKPPPVL